MTLKNKVALVTGSARGIGKAIAETLAKRGANLIVTDLNIDQAAATAEEIRSNLGVETLALQVDVSDFNSVNTMIKGALEAFDQVDILVNNAGITRDNLIMRMDESDWDSVLDVNLKGAWNCSKALIRSMMKKRYGRIINISSVSGLAGQAGQTNYSASKAGLIGLTKALAREVASRNITVNAVAPGFIPTALTVDLPDELKEGMMKLIPLNRWGTPEEIAYAVAFFTSDEAGYITGQVLSVDGGMMMM
ncbi:MAG: 3-oxoacyl-[acyl-carrier-protein] reductase [Anaerolineales bacterium]|nr:3-oxoacyl-[acyl-carrier-protein] reductase [Anaerolineales bacterium]